MKTFIQSKQEFRSAFFIGEILIFTAILHGINLIFAPAHPGFVGLYPNPHWITVLLIASRYGLLQGLTAGVFAAIVYIYFAVQSGAIDFSSMRFPHDGFRIPFLFILIGAITGEIRSLYKKQKEKLAADLLNTNRKMEDLNTLLVALSTSKQELERRIATQTSTLLSLFGRLNQIDTSDTQVLYSKILELLVEHLQAEAASIYLMQDNQLKLQERIDPKQLSILPDTLNLTEGIIGEVVFKKAVMSINQPGSEKDWQQAKQQPVIMAAPIKRSDESIIGIINIERLPFLIFNHHAVQIFTQISNWISTLIDKRLKFSEAEKERILDPASGGNTYTYAYFQKRLEYEMVRARRFGSTLSLALFRIQRFNEISSQTRQDLYTVLGLIFKKQLCDSVIIGRYKWPDTFAIIFTGHEQKYILRVIDDLQREINNFHFKPFENSADNLEIKSALSYFKQSMAILTDFEKEVESVFAFDENKSRIAEEDLLYLQTLGQSGPAGEKSRVHALLSIDETRDEFNDLTFLRVENIQNEG